MVKTEENFGKIFHQVFDENGNVRNCGRQNCQELIAAAKAASPIYGNEANGMMNVEAIKALYEELFPDGYNGDDKEDL